MKRIARISFFICMLSPFLAKAQEGFTVNIRLKGLGTNGIRIYHLVNGKTKLDTLKPFLKDRIVWKGRTPEPQIARIEVLDTTQYLYLGKAVLMPPQLSFMLTNCVIDIEGTTTEAYSAKVSSRDPDVQAYEWFHRSDVPLMTESWSLQREMNLKMKNTDTLGIGSIKDRINLLRKKNQSLRSAFIDKHPDAFASLCMLQKGGLIFTNEQMSAKFNGLDQRLRTSATGLIVEQRIESNRNTAAGKPVIPFRQEGIDGQMIDVNALAGKVVLIDFWGSWCVPCRKSHPSMKELYAAYKDRGFEIIGIANEVAGGPKPRDTQQRNWHKAIEDDGIPWKHILYDPDLSDLVKAYDIGAYPTKFLVGSDGRFIMRILGQSEQNHELLKKKLEELLPPR